MDGDDSVSKTYIYLFTHNHAAKHLSKGREREREREREERERERERKREREREREVKNPFNKVFLHIKSYLYDKMYVQLGQSMTNEGPMGPMGQQWVNNKLDIFVCNNNNSIRILSIITF